MANIRRAVTVTYPASGDLSASQLRIVPMDDNGRIIINTGTATPCLGILLNKPSAVDQGAEVAIIGSIVKLEAAGAVSERDAIRAEGGGRGSPTTTTANAIVGYALTPAAASADLFEVLVTGPEVFTTLA